MKPSAISLTFAIACCGGLALGGCTAEVDGFDGDTGPGQPPGDTVDPDSTIDPGPDAGPETVVRQPLINEFVINLGGVDTHEYVEVYGNPDSDLSHLTVLQIEASPSARPGTIDVALPVGFTSDTGHTFTGFHDTVFQNISNTLLLVEDFTGSVGDDIDADSDGFIDEDAPFGRVLDAIGLDDGNGLVDDPDLFYAALVMPPSGNSALGGASRITDGQDSGEPADWVENDRDGSGLPCCESAVAAPGEAHNSPNAPNSVAF